MKIFHLMSTPPIIKVLGLEYLLTLFSKQKPHVSSYEYRIHLENNATLRWSYPDQEFPFDKKLYERIFDMYIERTRSSPELQADLARYLARKFDSATNHPIFVECIETVRAVPPVGEKLLEPPAVKKLFAYPITSEDLALDAKAVTTAQDRPNK